MNAARVLFIALLFGSAALASCAHLPAGSLPGPTPSPLDSSSPTPLPSGSAACNTQATTTTVLVAMSSGISATPDPRYGTINGYTILGSSGTVGTVATVIPAHRNDILQFVNAEAGSSPIFHSAVGFPSGAFPSVPYSFPVAAQKPVGTAISTALWSTGRVAPSPDGGITFCFSQQFTLQTGTFYFGDFDYYNLSNMRDVIVVAP